MGLWFNMCFAKCVIHGTLGHWGLRIIPRMLYRIIFQKSHICSTKCSITISGFARQKFLTVFVTLHGYDLFWPPRYPTGEAGRDSAGQGQAGRDVAGRSDPPRARFLSPSSAAMAAALEDAS